jgi:3-hydroxymyristoyl/3-hydroxydecanoyl-(acyl carrier protein) dehydratase
MWHSTEFFIPADHPTAPGHFPGNPILPGALVLDLVVAAIAGERNSNAVQIISAKFLQPVRPGARVALRWQPQLSGIQFECTVAGQAGPVMTGVFAFAAAGA